MIKKSEELKRIIEKLEKAGFDVYEITSYAHGKIGIDYQVIIEEINTKDDDAKDPEVA